MPQYVGPDARPLRTIVDPFAPDGDVFNPAGAVTVALPGVRAGSGAPLSRVMLTFAFFDAGGARVVGGTANLRPFFIERPEVYGQDEGATGIVHPSSDALVDYDLTDPLIVTVAKHPEFGVNVTNITPPGGAAELCIALQEFT